MSTKIEWADETWNPLVGCTKCSPGCDHCYAIGVVHRGMSEQHVGLTVKREGVPTDWTGEVREVPHMLERPLQWKSPRRVFVNSLSDLFHPDVSSHFIASVFRVMARCPQHTFQILTKRPQRMLAWVQANNEITVPTLPNVWLGVSIESDRYAWRADYLRQTPAAVRWISAEPLLGPLPSLDLRGIDWVVVGGESGPGARPMHPDWVRDLRDRCTTGVECECMKGPTRYGNAGSPHHDGSPEECPDCYQGRRYTAFLFKQWGAWAPWISEDWSEEAGGSTYVKPDGTTSWAAGSDDYCTNWSANYEAGDAAITKVGKGKAGRVLDGRTWDEYPEPIGTGDTESAASGR